MAKKSFTGGMDLLLQSSKSNIETNKIADKEKKQPRTSKATYYLDAELLQKAKTIAYFERESISEIISQALKEYVGSYTQMAQAEEQYAKKHQSK